MRVGNARAFLRYLRYVLYRIDCHPNGVDIPNFSSISNLQLSNYFLRRRIPAECSDGLPHSCVGWFSVAASLPQLAEHERRR